jgi:hypothetical protein
LPFTHLNSTKHGIPNTCPQPPGYQAIKNIAANPVTIAPTATANPRDARGELPSDEILGDEVVVCAAVVEAEAAEAAEVADVGPTISGSSENCVLLAVPVQVAHPWGPPITTLNCPDSQRISVMFVAALNSSWQGPAGRAVSKV